MSNENYSPESAGSREESASRKSQGLQRLQRLQRLFVRLFVRLLRVGCFADLESGEAGDSDVLAHLRRRFGDELRNLDRRVADRLLVDEHDLFVEGVELPLDDLFDDLRLLAR